MSREALLALVADTDVAAQEEGARRVLRERSVRSRALLHALARSAPDAPAWVRLAIERMEGTGEFYLDGEDGVPSKLQRDVVASLQALGLAPREEVRTEQGYSLDAVVVSL